METIDTGEIAGSAGEADDAILSVRNMWVTFGSGRKKFEAVKGVSFDIHRQETFGLVGESGSGKSVSTQAIPGLLPHNAALSGSVLFEG